MINVDSGTIVTVVMILAAVVLAVTGAIPGEAAIGLMVGTGLKNPLAGLKNPLADGH
jgi:small-conductance mechanosensitive channel